MIVLPNSDPTLRAKVSQRQNYGVGADERLQSNVEFELSRLIEKEIHFHLKLEGEKRQLEAMADFNTVAVFSHLDPHSKGYLDFGIIKDFFCKYESEVMKEQILAIIRRLSDQPDGKISFREFSLGITPDALCLDQPACNTELMSELKQ